MLQLVKELKRRGIEVKEGVGLKGLCSIRTGGVARAVAFPDSVEKLVEALRLLEEDGVRYYVLAGGTKVIFPDGGFNGVVVHTGRLKGLRWLGEGRLEVLCGTRVSQVIAAGLRRGYRGLEFLAGLSATMGGALRMNAGAFGESVGFYVEEAEVLSKGRLVKLKGEAELWGYRKFNGPEGVFLRAVLRLVPSEEKEVKERIRQFVRKRRATQPVGVPSFGCAFKNPKEAPAGLLIEKAGLKGRRVGDAAVSKKHANFIVNLGAATSSDVLKLMDIVREGVLKEFGINLEPEVNIVEGP